MIKISVIIPCYNQEKYIAECLRSVLIQTFKDYEVIIVDDGSTDSSVKIIKSYMKSFKNIKLIQQKNQGVVAARNNAIKQAKGKYIYPLDADDIIVETTLEKSLKAMEEKKGDIIISQSQYFITLSDIFEKREKLPFYCPNKFNMLIRCCFPQSVLFRRSDFIKCGGYDHAFDKGWEDYDLYLNMIVNHNLKVYRIKEYLFFYRRKSEEESRNSRANKYTKELKKALYKKYKMMRWARIIYKIFNIRRFIYTHKITKSGIRTIKIFKIPIYRKRVK